MTLIQAAIEGDIKKVSKLINSNIDVNYADENDGLNALQQAAINKHLPIVKYLVQHGAKINYGKYGRTPLMFSISHGHFKISNYLIQNGADINHKDKLGWTVLVGNVFFCHKKIIKYILKNGGHISCSIYFNIYLKQIVLKRIKLFTIMKNL